MWIPGILVLILISATTVQADEEVISIGEIKQGLDTVWVLLGAFLVFFILNILTILFKNEKFHIFQVIPLHIATHAGNMIHGSGP